MCFIGLFIQRNITSDHYISTGSYIASILLLSASVNGGWLSQVIATLLFLCGLNINLSVFDYLSELAKNTAGFDAWFAVCIAVLFNDSKKNPHKHAAYFFNDNVKLDDLEQLVLCTNTYYVAGMGVVCFNFLFSIFIFFIKENPVVINALLFYLGAAVFIVFASIGSFIIGMRLQESMYLQEMFDAPIHKCIKPFNEKLWTIILIPVSLFYYFFY